MAIIHVRTTTPGESCANKSVSECSVIGIFNLPKYTCNNYGLKNATHCSNLESYPPHFPIP